MKRIALILAVLASLVFVGSADATGGSDHYCGQTNTSWDKWAANKATSCSLVRSTYEAVRSYQENGGISNNEEFRVRVKVNGKTRTMGCNAVASDDYANIQCWGGKFGMYFVWS